MRKDGEEVSAAEMLPKKASTRRVLAFFSVVAKLLKSVHTFISGTKDKYYSEIIFIFLDNVA